jgi:hypothetical protein
MTSSSFFAGCLHPRTLAFGLIALAAGAHAQVASVSPSVFNLSVLTGGLVSGVVTPAPGAGTGDRAATASICAALNVGATPGVSISNPCNPATVFGPALLGAATNSGAAQAFSTNFTAAQLATAASTLGAAGQAYGARKFFISIPYAASPVPPTSATRFVTLQVNLIEPPVSGVSSASAGLIDVSSTGPTPVSIRYALVGNDAPLAGQFCSALAAPYPATGVTTGNPCAPASVFGNVGSANGFSGAASSGETLVIPETIARQATQRAQTGGSGIFYFSRQFSSGKYAVVQLRLNANSANIPLVFTEVRLGFKDGGSLQNIGFFKRGQILPAVSAALKYQGAGVLRARWEVVQPGDTPPTALDLKAEATLSPIERAQQHRYRVIDRVSIYMPAIGQAVLSGPAARLLPNEQYGQYLLMLRIETSDSISGAAAGISPVLLPVLRYYIGESSGLVAQAPETPRPINLVSPISGAVLDKDTSVYFQWQENRNVSLYRLEIEANGKQVYAARVRPGANEGIVRYATPPFIAASIVNKAARWRVVALASDGHLAGESEWREIGNTP